jgi:positive regulator of sigma E activity
MNEFELPPSEPLWLKMAKQVYEQPLILMLLASSVVSALFGSYDDAICVLVAVGIVLTGTSPLYSSTVADIQSRLSRSNDPRNHWKL